MEPTRPRRRSLKSRGSVSSVIVSTASKGSGGGGVGSGMECWRRRRCYHDLHATVNSTTHVGSASVDIQVALDQQLRER